MSAIVAGLDPYLRLIRLHQPTGIWLLFWPGCWALLAAAHTVTSDGRAVAGWLLLFLAGSLLMRSIGCILNDMADIRFDRQVSRTKTRPLASGELTVKQAWAAIGVLLVPAFGIWLLLPGLAKLLCLASLPLVALYPFMKRWTWWPQLFLGITFNATLPAYATLAGTLDGRAAALFSAALLWTLGYDTLYAHQDKADDVRAGVKSTALKLGEQTKPFVALCYTGMMALLACVAEGVWALTLLAVIWLLLLRQALAVNLDDREAAGRAFRMNRWLGFGVALAFLLSFMALPSSFH